MTTALVTGFPTSFLAVRVLRALVKQGDVGRVLCVVPAAFRTRADEELSKLEERERRRVEVLEGDIASIDMGLSGKEFLGLAAGVELIHHCAAITYLGVDRAIAEHVNVGGTREVLELAGAAKKLERIVHWSTALISGTRSGLVLEDELEKPKAFRNVIEETRFRGERLIRRASSRLPTTTLRPSVIVGDSHTGEIDRFEGPYLLLLLMLNAPVDVRLPLPGRPDVPLNLVPIDYVIESGFAICADARSVGGTFHIVDPRPLPAKQVFELLAEAADRPRPRGFVPTNIASAILRTPGIERFSQVPRAFLAQLATDVIYDDRNARAVLDGQGPRCPSFDSYVRALVRFAREQQKKKRHTRVTELVDDPLG